MDATLRAGLCARSGGFAPRNTPHFLRDAEADAIELARRFGVARLNDYRDMFNLRRFSSMVDVNPDPQACSACGSVGGVTPSHFSATSVQLQCNFSVTRA